MTSDNDAAPGGSERIDVAVHNAGGDGPLTPRAAANSVIDWRRKNKASARTNATEHRQAAEQRRESLSAEAWTGAPGALADESGFAGSADSGAASAAPVWSAETLAKRDAAPQAEEPGAPGEPSVDSRSQSGADAEGKTERADPDADPSSDAELPPIEPPRSWTKDEKERFKSLPRETQEYLAAREQERDRDFRRSQNEAAEARKAIQADRAQLEQARLYYEQALPTLLQTLQSAHGHDFADLKSMDDVRKLSLTNPPRYAQWDAQQRQLAAVQNELAAAQQQQANESKLRLMAFAGRERERFLEKAPEMADDAERSHMRDAAVSLLAELGFSSEEMRRMFSGDLAVSPHDHRFHLLIRDAIRLRNAQAKARSVHGRPVPPVQKPGAAQPKGAARDAHIQNLSRQLDNARGLEALRLAAKLTAERRRAAS